ncbi:DUF3288 family protein [Prochlorococcus sp. MIT 1341]|uniref:DUF3288 family protein n=1 Tax=Prochlorococcus sp. MIT 1341 TaxID=3096221 RepID=UPI002A759614|nr:DUF3288 family protein [Prochlorococcus sp. MIT 1341]
MSGLQGQHEQSHPLYKVDRDLVDRLLAKQSPSEEDLVDLARLLIRFDGFPGAIDLQEDMNKTLNLWGLDRDSLNERVRKVWAKGYRPGKSSGDSVGSGFDTADDGVS